jgi:integrase
MLVRMRGLVKRGGVWQYRREVPLHLRSIIGAREVKRSLRTGHHPTALRLYPAVDAEIERFFSEAEAGVKSPAIGAYKAVEAWRAERRGRPEGEEALDHHITTLLARNDLDPRQRAALEALLTRQDGDEGDNPPLSILFKRYHEERKLPAKTKLEWDGVLRRFTAVVGDLPVKSVTPAHVRAFKASLIGSTSKRSGRAMAPGTVQKLLNALRSVLSWAKSEGYVTINPVEGITTIAKRDEEERRLPYGPEDLKKLFSREAVESRKGKPADEWLPYLALYTGARLEELGQLQTADVRVEDGIYFLAIEGGNGKRIKTRSSRRRVPIHPELVRLGFLLFVERQRAAGHARLFPELKPTSYGSVTAAWSKFWGRHARSLGVTDPRKVMHSFRHLWKDAARAAMPEEHHDAITGHSNGSVGRGYGTGVPIRVLAESMAKVRFRERLNKS